MLNKAPILTKNAYNSIILAMRELLLPIIQIALSILLITAILLQQRGTGLGAAFGGESTVFRTKRGIEKSLHYATIVIAILFFLTAIANVVLA